MIKRENAFCTKCGTNLSGGKSCGCNSSPKDLDRTVLVKAIFCPSCHRELYVDEKCNCGPMGINNYCKECGKRLYGDRGCDCQKKPMSDVPLKETIVKNTADTKKSGYFEKAGEL